MSLSELNGWSDRSMVWLQMATVTIVRDPGAPRHLDRVFGILKVFS